MFSAGQIDQFTRDLAAYAMRKPLTTSLIVLFVLVGVWFYGKYIWERYFQKN